MAYDSTCIGNQISQTWLPVAVWWWQESLLQEVLQHSLGGLRVPELLLCSVLIWLARGPTWPFKHMIILPTYKTALKYLNYIQKNGLCEHFCSCRNNFYYFQVSMHMLISSTAETAWASLGHSRQDANQHVWAYKLLPGENLQNCLKFPSGEFLVQSVKHFAVEKLHQAPISKQSIVLKQPLISPRQTTVCGVLDYPGN